jgi:hypothetical protein
VQADWAKIFITMHRNDGRIIDAELIRPRWWIAQHNIVTGKLLPMSIAELQVKGCAIVTSIEDCLEIANGTKCRLTPSPIQLWPKSFQSLRACLIGLTTSGIATITEALLLGIVPSQHLYRFQTIAGRSANHDLRN